MRGVGHHEPSSAAFHFCSLAVGIARRRLRRWPKVMALACFLRSGGVARKASRNQSPISQITFLVRRFILVLGSVRLLRSVAVLAQWQAEQHDAQPNTPADRYAFASLRLRFG